jgi:hypothetical protein
MVGSGTILELTNYGNTQVEGSIGNSAGLASLSCALSCTAVGYNGKILASAQIASVTNDNGAIGTFSNALNQAGPNQAIKFKLPGNYTYLNAGKVYPTLPKGVRLLGNCGVTGPLVYLDANKQTGLVLAGNNTLDGIFFYNFSGPGIKIPVNKGANKFQCTKIQKL